MTISPIFEDFKEYFRSKQYLKGIFLPLYVCCGHYWFSKRVQMSKTVSETESEPGAELAALRVVVLEAARGRS